MIFASIKLQLDTNQSSDIDSPERTPRHLWRWEEAWRCHSPQRGEEETIACQDRKSIKAMKIKKRRSNITRMKSGDSQQRHRWTSGNRQSQKPVIIRESDTSLESKAESSVKENASNQSQSQPTTIKMRCWKEGPTGQNFAVNTGMSFLSSLSLILKCEKKEREQKRKREKTALLFQHFCLFIDINLR